MKKLSSILLIIFIATATLSFILTSNFIGQELSEAAICDNNHILITQNINGNITEHCINQTIPFLVIFSFLLIYFNLSLSSLYFFIFYINRARKKNNKLIENENLIYQREIPEYNCALASYLLDGLIDVENDCEAMLLELQEEKIITITPEKIEVNKEEWKRYKEKPASNCANYLVWTIAYNQPFSKKKFKDEIIKDAKELGFVENSNRLTFLIFFSFIFLNAVGFITLFILLYIDTKNGVLTELSYKLTTKGSYEKDKILKLKKFLLHFSTIDELKVEEKHNWGRYVPFYKAMKK